MVYIRGGQVVEKRSMWRLSILADLFMALIAFITILCVAAASGALVGAAQRQQHVGSPSNSRVRPLTLPPHCRSPYCYVSPQLPDHL